MGRAQLIYQKISMIQNETGEDAYYFSALCLKGKKNLNKDATINEVSVEVRTKFVSVSRPYRKFTMRKSISH